MGTDIAGYDRYRYHLDDAGDKLPKQRQSQMSRPTFTPDHDPRDSKVDQVQRFAGWSIGISSILGEQILSHPCIVLRRQCQVHFNAESSHLTPFTLFMVIYNLHRHQTGFILWKGIGSVFVVRGISMVSETVFSEFTPFPKEISRHSSLKKLGEHVVLKCLAFIVTTPFYVASLIETVQSDIASERPGVLDCVKEGITRVIGWNTPQTTRLLPIWKLILPTVAFRLAHYMITSVSQYTVTSTIRVEQQESRGQAAVEGVDNRSKSVYDIYFPELLATFTGGLLADVMLFPAETVLHRLYLQGTRTIIDNTDTGLGVIPINTNYEGVLDCFKSIIMEEGLGGLYKGFGALVLQYAVHASLLKAAKYLFQKISERNGSTIPDNYSDRLVSSNSGLG
ncbi:hypothetical protein ScPMuIL_017678 [Solemya velum]